MCGDLGDPLPEHVGVCIWVLYLCRCVCGDSVSPLPEQVSGFG